jgi:thiosulfate/3-mercaptopyruvate sulfurtransferase
VGKFIDTYVKDRRSLEAIESSELRRRLKDGSTLVLDVRPSIEYEAGHIAGARSIPLDELSKGLKELPKEKTIIAYSRCELVWPRLVHSHRWLPHVPFRDCRVEVHAANKARLRPSQYRRILSGTERCRFVIRQIRQSPAFILLVWAGLVSAALSSQPAQSNTAAIPLSALIQPKDLVTTLKTSHRPLVLNVGPRIFYAQAHVPGAEYVGAAGTSGGLEALRKRLDAVDNNGVIVVYCGCCPWEKCPNIRPAFKELQNLGFTHVKALYIPSNFGTDWVNKGYPTEKGR